MKSIAAHSLGGIFAFAVMSIFAFASVHSRAFAQPGPANDHNLTRPEFYYVEGEVKLPQRYVYTNGLTLTAAIKRAKGITGSASSKVSITRMGQKNLVLDWKTIEEGKAKDIELRPGDKVFVTRK